MKKKIWATLLIIVCAVLILTGCISTGNQIIEITEGGYGFEIATNKVIRACVLVEARFSTTKSSGSGVIFTKDGYVITNRHVVTSNNRFSDNISVSVLSNDKKSFDTFSAKVITPSSLRETDLAILKINNIDKQFDYTLFGDSDALNFGESSFIVGYPKSLTLAVSPALISNPLVNTKTEDYAETEYVLISAPVNSGNSGGGLFNLRGELVGIVTLRYQDNTDNNEHVVLDIGYAQTGNKVIEFIKKHSELKDFV